jgi:single-stranded-DNA-specific exonuclease
MNIKNLKKAANRILKAIKNEENIILYGDNDLDGASSVIVLKEAITTLGAKISAIYFPDREHEGYGITKQSLKKLKIFSPGLLISLDCGIGNFKEIKLAKEIGFDVMVVDHHKVLKKVPGADIVVDPKQDSDNYPFKDFAATGIVFKLTELLLKKKMSSNLRKSFMELVALATIADMMPQVEENKTFIEDGLADIENSWRPGIKVFFEAKFLKEYDFRQKISKIISMLNVRDVQNGLPVSFRILTEPSIEKARKTIPELRLKTEERRLKIQAVVAMTKMKVLKNNSPIIFEGGPDFDYTIISPVASRLCNYFKKPTFIFKKLKNESQGTVRSTRDVDSVSLMGNCKEYVITYGGHAQASGFRIKNENLEKFKNCLINHFLKL